MTRHGKLARSEPLSRRRTSERRDVVPAAGRGCDHDRRAGGAPRAGQPLPEGPLERLADGKGLSDRVEAGTLGVGEVFGQLEQRQRIADRQLGQPPRGGRGDPAAEKLTRLVERESANDELVEAYRREGRILSLTEREQDRHPLVAQPRATKPIACAGSASSH